MAITNLNLKLKNIAGSSELADQVLNQLGGGVLSDMAQPSGTSWKKSGFLVDPKTINPAGLYDPSTSGFGATALSKTNISPETGKSILTSKERKSTIPLNYPFVNEYGTSQPSSNAYLANLPEYMGGGQFASDPSQKGSLIKSERIFEPEENIKLRGGLPSNLYEIDHIVPLWAGGSDTLYNKRIYFTEDHANKTAVENIVRPLYYAGKIDLNNARTLALNWQDKKIPKNVQFKDGEIMSDDPLGTAEKVFQSWSEPRKPSLKDIWGEVKTNLKKPVEFTEGLVGGLATTAAAAIGDLFVPGDKWGAIKEGQKYFQKTLAGKEGLSSTPLGQFPKAALAGFSGGWMPGVETEFEHPVDKAVSNITKFAGETAGGLLSFVALKGALGLAGKATGITSAAAKGVGSSLLPASVIGKDAVYVANKIPSMQKAAAVLENMGLFALHGQLSKQEEEGFKGRLKRATSDLASGAILGAAGHKVSGYAGVFAGTGILSYMAGADWDDALVNASVMTAFHGMGHGKGKNIEAQVKKAADQKSWEFRRSILEPNKPASELPSKKKFSMEEINNENATILERLNDDVRTGLRTPQEAQGEFAKAIVTGRQLWKNGLPKTVKKAEDLKDLESMVKKSKEVPAGTDRGIHPDVVEYFSNNLDSQPPIMAKVKGKPITGRTWITGMGESVNPTVKANVARADVEMHSGMIPKEIYLVRRDDMNGFMSALNRSGKGKVLYENPQYNVEAVVKTSDGKILSLGWMPDKTRIDGRPQSQNSRIRDLNLKHPDQEPMQEFDKNFNKDVVAKAMEDNGVRIMKVPVEAIDRGIESGQPYIILDVKNDNLASAINSNKQIKGITKSQTDLFLKRMYGTAGERLQKVSKLPVETVGEGSMIENELAKSSSKSADTISAIEREYTLGTQESLAKTINEKFGDVIKPEDLKPFFEATPSQPKTMGDLMKVVVDKAGNSDKGMEFSRGLNDSKFNPQFVYAFEDAMKTPLERKAEIKVNQWKNVIRNLKEIPKNEKADAEAQKVIEKVKTAVQKEGPFSKELLSLSGQYESRMRDVTLGGYESRKTINTKVDAYISDFERDFNSRYSQIKIQIKNASNLTPQEKTAKLGQLDKVFSKKSLGSLKEALKGRTLAAYENASPKILENQGEYTTVEEEVNKQTGKVETKAGESLKTENLPNGDMWREQSQKSETKWGDYAREGHTVEHLFKENGELGGKIRIDGKEFTYKEAQDKVLKPAESKNNLLLQMLKNIKKPQKEANIEEYSKDDFWNRVKKANPNFEEKFKKLNYETFSREDRQPEPVIDWVTSIRAKKYSDLPKEAYEALKTSYGKEMKSQGYIPTYPGSPLFKKFLSIWEKNYSSDAGEFYQGLKEKPAVSGEAENQRSEILQSVKSGGSQLEEGKSIVSRMDFFTKTMEKVKGIKSDKLKEKAISDLVKDFSQLFRSEISRTPK